MRPVPKRLFMVKAQVTAPPCRSKTTSPAEAPTGPGVAAGRLVAATRALGSPPCCRQAADGGKAAPGGFLGRGAGLQRGEGGGGGQAAIGRRRQEGDAVAVARGQLEGRHQVGQARAQLLGGQVAADGAGALLQPLGEAALVQVADAGEPQLAEGGREFRLLQRVAGLLRRAIGPGEDGPCAGVGKERSGDGGEVGRRGRG